MALLRSLTAASQLVAVTALLALSACSEPAPAPAPASPQAASPAPAAASPASAPVTVTEPLAARFDCGGTGVDALFAEGVTTLVLDGESIRLTAVAAASGARYQGMRADGVVVEFWNQGEAATLTVAGNAYPECAKSADDTAAAPPTAGTLGDPTVEAPVAYAARGHEPFWSAQADAVEVRWQTPDAALPQVFTGLTRAPRDGGFDLAATREGGTLALAATQTLCRDSMTGMPYPDTVTVRVDDVEYRGCGGDPRAVLAAHEWSVGLLAGEATGESPPTLAFLPDDRAGGFGGCNRWSAPTALTGEGLSFGPAASTMMACPDAAMALERRFLDALATITRHDIDADGALLLMAGDTVVITATASPAPAMAR